MSYEQKEAGTIDLTRNTFRMTGFWKKSQEEQTEIITGYFNALKELWQIEFGIEVHLDDEMQARMTGGASFNHTPPTLLIYKASVMTILHMFKHVLRTLVPDYPVVNGEPQQDSAIWAHTIFKLALPVLYERNVQEGKFMIPIEEWFPLEGVQFPTTDGTTSMGSQHRVAAPGAQAPSTTTPLEQLGGQSIEEIIRRMRERRGLELPPSSGGEDTPPQSGQDEGGAQ